MRHAIAAAILLLFAHAVHADSDGYFCAGRGYVAYEFNGISVPRPGHVLSVVFLGGDAGIAQAVEVPLPAFQAHGMRCLPGRVEILAWDERLEVDISNRDQPVLAHVAPSAAGASVSGFGIDNLAELARDGILALDADGRFDLVIEVRVERVPHGLLHHVRSRIVQRGADGAAVRERTLFDGSREEIVDSH